MGQIKTPEEEENPRLSEVTQAQKETGELLWVARRTRPDICLAVSLMRQWAAKRPRAVMDIGKQVRAYLRQTRDEGLVIRGTTVEEEKKSEAKDLTQGGVLRCLLRLVEPEELDGHRC